MCNYVIARNPPNLPTSERAIPVAIFRWVAVGVRGQGCTATHLVGVGAHPRLVRVACSPVAIFRWVGGGCDGW